MPKHKPPKPKRSRRPPRVVEGGREALERELLWAIALDGNRRRIEVLKRMLTPAANDSFAVTMLAENAGDPNSPPVGFS